MSGNDPIEAFVEAFGLQAELSGWPRIAGKILGHLVISPEPDHTLDDLVVALGISKASASGMTRFLIERGFVQRVSHRGDRRIFHRVTPDVWARLLRSRLRSIEPFRDLARTGATLVRSSDERAAARMTEMAEFYEWWQSESDGLWARWEAYRSRKTGPPAEDDDGA